MLVGDHVLLGSSHQVMGREGTMFPQSGRTEVYDVDISDDIPGDPL